MAEKTLQQDTRTFQVHRRRRLIAAALSMAIAIVLAVVVWVDHANGIPFRVIWDLVWFLMALIAVRIARLGVQVRRDRLIIRGFLRKRTFNASQISGFTVVREHYQTIWSVLGTIRPFPWWRQHPARGSYGWRDTRGAANHAGHPHPGDRFPPRCSDA